MAAPSSSNGLRNPPHRPERGVHEKSSYAPRLRGFSPPKQPEQSLGGVSQGGVPSLTDQIPARQKAIMATLPRVLRFCTPLSSRSRWESSRSVISRTQTRAGMALRSTRQREKGNQHGVHLPAPAVPCDRRPPAADAVPKSRRQQLCDQLPITLLIYRNLSSRKGAYKPTIPAAQIDPQPLHPPLRGSDATTHLASCNTLRKPVKMLAAKGVATGLELTNQRHLPRRRPPTRSPTQTHYDIK